MDTVLCLDSSASMGTGKMGELKRAVAVFIEHAERTGLGERIAIIPFGGLCQRLVELSDDYSRVRRSVDEIRADGTTPMAEALLLALKEVTENGKITSIAEAVTLMPRVILMTDGEPDSKAKVREVVALFAQLRIPIACVGVTGCDRKLLQEVAHVTGGMFTMADRMQDLSTFFLRQVLLTLFIVQFARDVACLHSLVALRQFLLEQTGQAPGDEEIQTMLLFVHSITRGANTPRVASTSPPRVTSGGTQWELSPQLRNLLVWAMILGAIVICWLGRSVFHWF